MGRPLKELDRRQIKELAKIQCTLPEIAAVMGCHKSLLEKKHLDIISEGRDIGKSSLRRAQFQKALEGNPAMLVWLGKHYLDQKESVQIIGNHEPEVRKLLQRWEDGRDLSTGAPFKLAKKRIKEEQPPQGDCSQLEKAE